MGERESFRTVPSVKDGIVVSEEQFCAVRVIDYQPGNGTRYAVSFVKMEHFEGHVLNRFELEPNCWLVTLHNIGGKRGKRPASFYNKAYVNLTYVHEKFDIGWNDAAVLTELIAHVVGGRCEPIYDLTNMATAAEERELARDKR